MQERFDNLPSFVLSVHGSDKFGILKRNQYILIAERKPGFVKRPVRHHQQNVL